MGVIVYVCFFFHYFIYLFIRFCLCLVVLLIYIFQSGKPNENMERSKTSEAKQNKTIPKESKNKENQRTKNLELTK